MNSGEKKLVIISKIILSVSLLIWLFPIMWFLLASFKNPRNLYDIFSFEFSLYNYYEVFNTYPIATYMKNSLILAVLACLFAVTIGTLIAYGLSHTRFRFKTQTTIFIFLIRLIPGMAVMVPLFIIFSSLGLTNTYSGLIIAHTAMSIPLVVIIMLGYLSDFPKELLDAAYIDGCNRFNVIFLIVFPLIKPGLAVVAIFTFIASWNNFDISLILGYMPEYRTLPVGLAGMGNKYGILWHHIAAAGAVYIVPTVIMAIALSKYVISGLTVGAIKG
jgi:multiple sugar transport system permease protein|tara:strand:+ start:2415 stop:3236 length:822 start_codon:yes stop_codon:yes gene_type:complete